MLDWLPGATRRDAPASKHGYGGVPEPQAKQGIVFHSMEGSLAAALGELDKLSRQASWTFSNPKSGPMLQHYPLGFHTWASGSDIANVRFTSIEHEGVAGEPLTPSQVANDIALLKWMGLDWKRPANPSDLTATLYEHRECVRFGSASTACPSGRILWPTILAAMEDDMPTQQEWDDFKAAYKLDIKRVREDIVGLSSELTALRDAVRVDIRAVRESVAAHAATPHGGGGVSEERVKEIVRELVAD